MSEIFDRPGHRRHRRKHLSVAGSRILLLLIILAVGIGGYALGFNIARQDITAGKQLIQQLQTEGQKLQKQVQELSGSNTALQSKLTTTEATMHAMEPSQNTYILKPNQSITVADGHLVLGLIGTPENDRININVNGERHASAPGDIINVAPDASTACRVVVQLFDMFGARVTATCQPKS